MCVGVVMPMCLHVDETLLWLKITNKIDNMSGMDEEPLSILTWKTINTLYTRGVHQGLLDGNLPRNILK